MSDSQPHLKVMLHQRRETPLPGGRTLKVDCALLCINDNPPVFETRAQLWNQVDGQSNLKMTGVLGELVLEAWPDLAPVLALHLCDELGAPLYAQEVSWRWAGGAEPEPRLGGRHTSPPSADVLAKTLRIDLETAQTMVDAVTSGSITHAEFSEFVDEQRPRWQSQASAVRSFLQTGSWPEAPAARPSM